MGMEYRDHIYFLIGDLWVWLGLKLRLDKNGFRELRKLHKKCNYWDHFLSRGSEGVICLPPESSDKGGPESQLTSDSDPKFGQKFGLDPKFWECEEDDLYIDSPNLYENGKKFLGAKSQSQKVTGVERPPPSFVMWQMSHFCNKKVI